MARRLFFGNSPKLARQDPLCYSPQPPIRADNRSSQAGVGFFPKDFHNCGKRCGKSGPHGFRHPKTPHKQAYLRGFSGRNGRQSSVFWRFELNGPGAGLFRQLKPEMARGCVFVSCLFY